MTRLEIPAQDQPINRDELKKVIRHELFFEIFRRKALGCLGWLLIAFLVLGVPTLLIASAFAKSGFADVPVLSRWLYEPSEPIRAVRPYAGTTTDDVLTSVGRRAKYDLHTGLVTVTVSETEFTTIVAESIATAPPDSLPFPISSVQVAIEPRTVELFAISPQEGRDATVRLRVSPTVASGKLGLEVRELRLGAQNIPKSLAQFGTSFLTGVVSRTISEQFAAAGELVDVETDIGELRLIMLPKKD